MSQYGQYGDVPNHSQPPITPPGSGPPVGHGAPPPPGYLTPPGSYAAESNPAIGGPGHGMPPGKSRRGPILLATAVVLVVALAVGATLYATGMFGITAGEDDKSAASDSAGDEPTRQPPKYVARKGACERLDLSGFEAVFSKPEDFRHAGDGSSLAADFGFSCGVAFDSGTGEDGACIQCIDIGLSAYIFNDADLLDEEYAFNLDYLQSPNVIGLYGIGPVSLDEAPAFEAWDGEWEEGNAWCGYHSNPMDNPGDVRESSQCLSLLRDGNLIMIVDYYAYTPEIPEHMDHDTMREMMSQAVAATQEILAE